MKTIIVLLSLLGVLSFTSSCSNMPETGQTAMVEMEQTETNHTKLVKAVPPPRLSTSLERKNLSKRLERFNNENKVSYIYLVSFGKIMAHYTMKGKVSSVNSLLTTPEQLVVRRNYGDVITATMPSPDLDGSYGENGDGIFFFTTEDVYVEWSGQYMLCDQPLKLTQPPELIIDVNEKP